MIKHLISAASFALGGAGVALVAHFTVQPYAFTHSMTAHAPEAALARAAPAPVEVATIGPPLVLAETRITTSRAGMKRRVLPARLDRCSEWSDMAPLFVDETGTGSVPRAHTLCPRPGDER